jgi:hypothetical protein
MMKPWSTICLAPKLMLAITGHIDRASGRMDVTTVTLDPTKPNDPNIAALRYDVICETNSVF